ncbi:flavin-binding monooxygenase [Cenococcum geophilum 1.58]|uniref:flavin-binding monooxygenase n=1 Tax=Cenococcum geophilum 1.58 TaxID=794803 RepID=UPI00358EC41E|nr:flavin-binding monooxygenase [Cenococcum geophilum 1.58]
MAPDLNSPASNGRWDYSKPGSSGYGIPNIIYNDPSSRPLRVITIAAGLSGILMAYQIQKYCENIRHNRYPGYACDIPSHAYTYNFVLNPDWLLFLPARHPRVLSKAIDTFELRKCMTFKSYWLEDTRKWKVKLRQQGPGQEQPHEFEEECNLLLYATRILNNFKWPDIQGLHDFKGRIVHTGVAVIGSGASSIQTVPNMQLYVKRMDIANGFGANKEYTEEDRNAFCNDPKVPAPHTSDVEGRVNGIWGKLWGERMAGFLKDERLVKGFTLKWEVGWLIKIPGRHVTPGDPYMEATQKENVDVHFTQVERITEEGVVGGDGIERKVDTIICATGFDVTYKRPVENGTVTGPLLLVSEYAVRVIKMQEDNIKGWVPKQDIVDNFNEHAQEWIKHTVWNEDSRSRYKNNDIGKVSAVRPGSSLHYTDIIAQPRYEDFEIKYEHKNPWVDLSMGYTLADSVPDSDVTPYLQLEKINLKWFGVVGAPKGSCKGGR